MIEVTHTFSQADFDTFAELTGDDNPIHVDPVFSADTRFGRTVAHGMLLYSRLYAILADQFPGYGQPSIDMMFMAPTFTDEPMTYRIYPVEEGEDAFRVEIELLNPAGDCTLKGETRLEKGA